MQRGILAGCIQELFAKTCIGVLLLRGYFKLLFVPESKPSPAARPGMLHQQQEQEKGKVELGQWRAGQEGSCK